MANGWDLERYPDSINNVDLLISKRVTIERSALSDTFVVAVAANCGVIALNVPTAMDALRCAEDWALSAQAE